MIARVKMVEQPLLTLMARGSPVTRLPGEGLVPMGDDNGEL